MHAHAIPLQVIVTRNRYIKSVQRPRPRSLRGCALAVWWQIALFSSEGPLRNWKNEFLFAFHPFCSRGAGNMTFRPLPAPACSHIVEVAIFLGQKECHVIIFFHLDILWLPTCIVCVALTLTNKQILYLLIPTH